MTAVQQKIVGISLALLPPLCIYKVLPGFTLATILTLFCFIISIGKRDNKKIIGKNETILFIAVTILGFLSFILNSSTSWYKIDTYINNYFALTINFLAVITLSYRCNARYFIGASIILSVIASIICIYQWMMVLVSGSRGINFYIPGFDLIRDVNTISLTRPCSFFTEPAHVCMYIAPALYTTILLKKYYLSIIVILGLLFSSSTTGFLFLFLIPLIYLINNKVAFVYIIGVVCLFLFGYYCINSLYPEILEFTSDKLLSTDLSEDQRLLGPFKYVSLMNTVQIIFGIGLNQLEAFVLSLRGSLLMSGSGNYANSILYMFFSYGLVGFFFLLFYVKKYWNRSRNNIGYVVILVAVMASDQILFAPFFIYFVTYLILSANKYINL